MLFSLLAPALALDVPAPRFDSPHRYLVTVSTRGPYDLAFQLGDTPTRPLPVTVDRREIARVKTWRLVYPEMSYIARRGELELALQKAELDVVRAGEDARTWDRDFDALAARSLATLKQDMLGTLLTCRASQVLIRGAGIVLDDPYSSYDDVLFAVGPLLLDAYCGAALRADDMRHTVRITSKDHAALAAKARATRDKLTADLAANDALFAACNTGEQNAFVETCRVRKIDELDFSSLSLTPKWAMSAGISLYKSELTEDFGRGGATSWHARLVGPLSPELRLPVDGLFVRAMWDVGYEQVAGKLDNDGGYLWGGEELVASEDDDEPSLIYNFVAAGANLRIVSDRGLYGEGGVGINLPIRNAFDGGGFTEDGIAAVPLLGEDPVQQGYARVALGYFQNVSRGKRVGGLFFEVSGRAYTLPPSTATSRYELTNEDGVRVPLPDGETPVFESRLSVGVTL